jgi:hypothetical protein
MMYAVHALLKALWRLEKENETLRSALSGTQHAAQARPLGGLPYAEVALRPGAGEQTGGEAGEQTGEQAGKQADTSPEMGRDLYVSHVSDALLELAGMTAPLKDPADIFTAVPWQLALLCTQSTPVLVSIPLRIRTAQGGSLPVLAMPLPLPHHDSAASRTSWRFMVLPVDGVPCEDGINLTRAMADNMIDMLWAKDTKGRYLFANRAICEKLLCCDGIDPLGRDDIYFARRQRALGWQHTFGELCLNSDDIVLLSQKPGRFVEDGLVQNKYLALEVQKSPLYDPRGVLIGTVGTGRDITRQKEAEEALRRSEHRFGMVLRATSDIIWAYDIAKDTMTCGKMDSPDPFRAMQECHCLPVHHEELKDIKDHVSRFFREGGDNLQHEFNLTAHDGNTIWLLSRGRVMEFDEKGAPLLAVGSHTDITELKTAQVAAEAAAKAKSAFLATMSHEIRTPLNGVLGMLQILGNEITDPKPLRLTRTALDSGRKLLAIINDILDFSTIDAGAAPLDHAPLRIRETVNSVLANFSEEVRQKGLTLTAVVDRAVPDVLVGDESRIRQILFNLVGNAVKFTREGSVRVDVLLLTAPADEEARLLVTVEDTGIGMEAEMLPRIFDPFFQVDGTYRRRYQGTGLGLGIVRSLVSMMHGNISVESTPGMGTTICCSLLLRKAQPQEQPAGGQEQEIPALPPARILLAEDEEVNRMAATYLLRKMGHTVTAATSGLHVIELLQDHEPDCILMDIQMPDMDGIETTKVIRGGQIAGLENIPIIALTAHAMKGDKEIFLAAGMDGYISKPIDAAELQRELYRILHTGKNKKPPHTKHDGTQE